MTIKAIDISPFHLPLTNGPHREGLIIKLTTENGNTTYGEVSPLPGWSVESFNDALINLNQIKKELLENGNITTLCYPSVLFGLDQAMSPYSDHKDIKEEPLFISFNDLPSEKNIKVKLKGKSAEEGIQIIRKLQSLGYKPSIDLNRSWPLEKTLSLCSHISSDQISYIEEPTTKFCDLEAFHKQSGYFYALDETLLNHPLQRIVSLHGLSTLIIKPTLYGGKKEIQNIIDHTPHLDIRLSSAYETNIGTKHLRSLAHTFNLPVGLDTYKFFADNIWDI